MNHKIIPCIWITADGGHLKKVIDYYQSAFGVHFKAGQTIPLGQTPSGNSEMCEIEIFDRKYSFMNTQQSHHALNDAVSFVIKCSDQNEIDHYWNYFTLDGEESQCGWCIDKYGVRWQIIPHNLGELMTQPNSFEVMMKQKKIIIEDYSK